MRGTAGRTQSQRIFGSESALGSIAPGPAMAAVCSLRSGIANLAFFLLLSPHQCCTKWRVRAMGVW